MTPNNHLTLETVTREVYSMLGSCFDNGKMSNYFVKDINILEELKDIPKMSLEKIRELIGDVAANPKDYYPKNVGKVKELLDRLVLNDSKSKK